MRQSLLVISLAVAVLVAGCSVTQSGTTSVTVQETNTATHNQADLLAKEPVPTLTDSIERQNLIERAKFLNNTKFQSCIYLFAQNGALVGWYPVKRKPSSLNSYLLPGDKIVQDPYTESYDGAGGQVVEQADIDGAYGKNADGIFFFAQDTGEYVEWQGDYLYTSNCSKPAQQPALIRNVPAN